MSVQPSSDIATLQGRPTGFSYDAMGATTNRTARPGTYIVTVYASNDAVIKQTGFRIRVR